MNIDKIFNLSSKNTEIQKELEKFQKDVDLDKLVISLVVESLATGRSYEEVVQDYITKNVEENK